MAEAGAGGAGVAWVGFGGDGFVAEPGAGLGHGSTAGYYLASLVDAEVAVGDLGRNVEVQGVEVEVVLGGLVGCSLEERAGGELDYVAEGCDDCDSASFGTGAEGAEETDTTAVVPYVVELGEESTATGVEPETDGDSGG